MARTNRLGQHGGMTSYDRLIAVLQEHALTGVVELQWSVKVHDDLLTHIDAATKERHASPSEAWTSAQALADQITGAGYKMVYRNKIGVDSSGWQTDEGTPEGWYGFVEIIAMPASS
jgi:hypothetical protein